MEGRRGEISWRMCWAAWGRRSEFNRRLFNMWSWITQPSSSSPLRPRWNLQLPRLQRGAQMRRPEASSRGLGSRKWIVQRDGECLRGPIWKHAGNMRKISAALSRVSHSVGRFRRPLYVTSSMAKDTFVLRRTFCVRRVGRNRRELAPSPNIQQNDDSSLLILRPAAPRKSIAPATD